MKSTTTRFLAIIVGSLALGASGGWYLGIPLVAAQKKTQDTHQHDEHGHTEKPKGRGAQEQTKAQSKSKGQEQEEHKHDEHEEEKIVRLTEAKRKELGIEVATAQSRSLQTQLSLTGAMSINTDRFVRIVSRIPGVVREVRKNLGDTVRAGEVMAVIDSRELADAKGSYLAATERVTLTADTFQREKDLWEKKISPAEDYFKAKQAHAEARIELRSAKQKLMALGFADAALKQLASEPEASFTRYEIMAPLAGTVIEKRLNVGEFVKDDTEVFNVADLRTVWVNLNVPPVDLRFVEKGQRVHITAGAGLPEVEARISYIGSVVMEETRTVPVRAELSNPDGRWRPGLFVTARLTTKETTASVLIPQAAIQTIEGKPSVFVQIPEGFEARPVTLGQSNETHTEIMAGLAAGERYAATETFVLKADLGKSEAEHQH